jgi:hypothetical protein
MSKSVWVLLLLLLSASVSQAQVSVTATLATLNGSYGTVKGAFDAINAGTHKGVIAITVTANTTETASAVLNASGIGGSSYTSISIQPQGNVTVAGTLAAPVIDLNSADNVTINGLNSGGNSLTIQNASTSGTLGTSAMRMINGAANNTVTNCSLFGSSTGATGVATAVFVVGVGANTGNTLSNSKVGPAGSNLPTICITAIGGTNNTLQILGNEVYDFYHATASQAGIYLGSGSSFATVQGNKIYQTAARVLTGNTQTVYGILYVFASSRCTISNNVVGFANAAGTGVTDYTATAAMYRPIMISGSNALASQVTSVQGNTVSGIVFSSARVAATVYNAAFVGIDVGMTSNLQSASDIGSSAGNIIGSLDGSSSIHITMTGAGNFVPNIGIAHYMNTDNGSISNNQIGSIVQDGGPGVTSTGFNGIVVNYNTNNLSTAMDVTNNTIGGSSTGSITNNIAGNAPVYGILLAGVGTRVRTNTIRNLWAHHSNGTTSGVAGLVATSAVGSRALDFHSNTIYDLHNDASGIGDSYTDGIYFNIAISNGQAADANLISGLSASGGTVNYITGIRTVNSGDDDVRNNMISLGLDASAAQVTGDPVITGVWDNGSGSNEYYHNSVYIGGTSTGSANSYGFSATNINGNRVVRNNIFMNARTNSVGIGKHYAFRVDATVPLTSDYDDLFVSGNGGLIALASGVDYATLAAFQGGTSGDVNSISMDPGFLNAAAASTAVDLHVPGTNSFLAVGTFTTSFDFDGQTRNTTTPSIGADETCVAPTLTTNITFACTNVSNGSVDLITTGGTGPFTYAWTNTGFFTASTQDISGLAPDIYSVTVTTPGGCSVTQSGINVEAAGPGTATISYTGTPFCGGSGNVAVNRNGSANGTYSAPAGLSLNTTTGVINIGTSTPGTYIVTYTYGGACINTATTSVTIGTVGSLLFVNPQPNQVLCAGQSTANAIFTSSAGLAYTWQNTNASIGIGTSGSGAITSFTAINNGTTPQTAVISVTGTSNNGCRYKVMVFRITVKPLPSVNQPANNIICAGNLTNPVFFNSPVPGTVFSWANNNVNTGVPAAGTSDMPSYTSVNNTGSTQVSTVTVTPYAAACAGTPKTFTVTVSPSAGSISYPNGPFCPSGTVNVVRAGSTGGVFSAPVGLVVNPTTGAISLGQSLPGTYTVSYTVGATGGCSGLATTQVTVNEIADVNPVPNPVYCDGINTANISFQGIYSFVSWTNDNTSIGLAASGVGSVLSFLTTNPGPASRVAIIKVVPHGDANLCTGKTMAFRITVNYCPPISHAGDHSGDDATSRIALQVTVGPNPTQNHVRVSVNKASLYSLQVLNQQGLPLSSPATFTGTNFTLNLERYRPGVYVLQLIDKTSGLSIRKLVTKL